MIQFISNKFMSSEEKTRRLEICEQCPHKKIMEIPLTQKQFDYCEKCGCPLATRIHTVCPIGKW
jgi:hypothetical protein